MSLSVIDRNEVLTDELRKLAERRLLFALSRFDSRIRAAELEVGLNVPADPEAGTTHPCRLTVKLDRADEVTIRDQDRDVVECVRRIAARAGRAVARAIDRSSVSVNHGSAFRSTRFSRSNGNQV